MEKAIRYITRGYPDAVGEFQIYRLIPNPEIQSVGPFVFLDHLPPVTKSPGKPSLPDGHGAHPHRGIATFSYVISGELEHFDSRGNHGIVTAGGAQWMKAGNGILHDEGFSQAFQQQGGVLHSLQFWINLPAKNKAELPAYIQIDPSTVPEIPLAGQAGTLRVLIGEYEGLVSKVDTYSPQFLHEILLKPGGEWILPDYPGWEQGVFVPEGEVEMGGQRVRTGEFALLGNASDPITMKNKTSEPVRILFFGGEHYSEPIVAKGPFVMNSQSEITRAYSDYVNGKYGKIHYTATESV
jgi:redox-sensitive bicupin YhaK (pirin superfamily)